MSPTPSDDRIHPPSDIREHDRSGTLKRDYRPLADQAQARLEVPIGKACDVELQAVSHTTAGTGPATQASYVAILESLRQRKQTAERAHNGKRATPKELSTEPSHQDTCSYTRTLPQCRTPIPVTHQNAAGASRDQTVGCGYCDPCRLREAEITAGHAARVVGESGYAMTIPQDQYRAVIVRLDRGDIEWFQVPGPDGYRRVLAAEPVAPSVPVDISDAARDAELTRPEGDGRRTSYRGQRRRDAEARPPNRQEVEQELFGTTPDPEWEGAVRVGFWNLKALGATSIGDAPAALAARADEYGLPHTPAPGGIEIAADADRIALAQYRRSLGFVPLGETRKRQHAPPALPIAEAYALWRRWHENDEPPAELYDQLAMLEVAS